jgi:hypothetical protein
MSLIVAASAVAQERVHSDLPLFSGANEELWPRGFVSEDSFGCTSRIAFGDWKQTISREEGGDPDVEWLRFGNYGVFHCAIVESSAGERADLVRAGFKHSWFVELGTASGPVGRIELWALQSGARPGSDYLLLSRKPGTGTIKTFHILQLKCARNQIRQGKSLDSWRTDYCSVNSASEWRSLAHKMAKLPPAGTIELVETLPRTEEADR